MLKLIKLKYLIKKMLLCDLTPNISHKNKIKQSGQGLIETLIALLIISGGAIALIQFEHNLSYNNNLAQQQAEATLFATQQIESLRNFAVINNTSGYNAYQSIATGNRTANGANTTYTLNWTVTTSSTTPSYKTIDLIVSWTDSYGNAQSIDLTTIIAGLDPAYQANII